MHTNAPIPIETKNIEIDYFKIVEDQLGRTVILSSVWEYYHMSNTADMFIYFTMTIKQRV